MVKQKPGIKLETGESVIFGYGSLLSIASLEHTLGRSYEGPFLACTLDGWRRSWDAAMPNETIHAETATGQMVPEMILYLNIRPDPGTSVNGIAFVVNEADLANYDKREWIYDRDEVTASLDVPIEGGPAYTYVCNEEYRRSDISTPRQGAVRATYVQIVEAGLADLGEEFRTAYYRTSDPVPQHLVIPDRS